MSSFHAKEIEKNKGLVCPCIDLVNVQEIEKTQGLISPKQHFCLPHKPSPLHWNGHGQPLYLVYFTAVPHICLDVEDRIADGNKVIVRMICTGTKLTIRAFR